MTLKNAQPRFGLMDDGRLMDYKAGKVVDATGTIKDTDGTWDLAKVAELIQTDKPVEGAMVSGDSASSSSQVAAANAKTTKAQGTIDKIKQAWKDFEKHFESDDDDKVAAAGVDFHTTIADHLAAHDAAASDATTGNMTIADSQKVAPGFPQPGQATENLGASGKPLASGSFSDVGPDTKATPGNTALQQNKAFTDSKKASATVDGHDIVKAKQLGENSDVVKEAGKDT